MSVREYAYEYIDKYVRAHACARANVHVYTIIFHKDLTKLT